MTWLEAFKKAYDECPSQDNEGYIPDRGAFKLGFHAAWTLRQGEIDTRIEKLREALSHYKGLEIRGGYTLGLVLGPKTEHNWIIKDHATPALAEDDEAAK